MWRSRDEMVFLLLPHDGKLLFSTGAKGRVYSLDGPRNTTLLLESTEEQTTRLLEVGNRFVRDVFEHWKAVSRIGDGFATSRRL